MEFVVAIIAAVISAIVLILLPEPNRRALLGRREGIIGFVEKALGDLGFAEGKDDIWRREGGLNALVSEVSAAANRARVEIYGYFDPPAIDAHYSELHFSDAAPAITFALDGTAAPIGLDVFIQLVTGTRPPEIAPVVHLIFDSAGSLRVRVEVTSLNQKVLREGLHEVLALIEALADGAWTEHFAARAFASLRPGDQRARVGLLLDRVRPEAAAGMKVWEKFRARADLDELLTLFQVDKKRASEEIGIERLVQVAFDSARLDELLERAATHLPWGVIRCIDVTPDARAEICGALLGRVSTLDALDPEELEDLRFCWSDAPWQSRDLLIDAIGEGLVHSAAPVLLDLDPSAVPVQTAEKLLNALDLLAADASHPYAAGPRFEALVVGLAGLELSALDGQIVMLLGVIGSPAALPTLDRILKNAPVISMLHEGVPWARDEIAKRAADLPERGAVTLVDPSANGSLSLSED